MGVISWCLAMCTMFVVGVGGRGCEPSIVIPQGRLPIRFQVKSMKRKRSMKVMM